MPLIKLNSKVNSFLHDPKNWRYSNGDRMTTNKDWPKITTLKTVSDSLWVEKCPNCGSYPKITIKIKKAYRYMTSDMMWHFHFHCDDDRCPKQIQWGDCSDVEDPFDKVVDYQVKMWNVAAKRYVFCKERDAKKTRRKT